MRQIFYMVKPGHVAVAGHVVSLLHSFSFSALAALTHIFKRVGNLGGRIFLEFLSETSPSSLSF
jgi:ABC-type phosphate/phosphonate transport system permease subunit